MHRPRPEGTTLVSPVPSKKRNTFVKSFFSDNQVQSHIVCVPVSECLLKIAEIVVIKEWLRVAEHSNITNT